MAVTACVRRRWRLLLAVVVAAATLPGLAHADAAKPWANPRHVWYVSATARPGGDGSRHSPFRRLLKVQQASRAGDKIVILPAPKKVAPLDGGIRLKPGQP